MVILIPDYRSASATGRADAIFGVFNDEAAGRVNTDPLGCVLVDAGRRFT